MGTDDDLAGLLPEPPPPRPGRRDAAFAAAMRRFDGVPDPAPAPARPPAHAPGRWKMPGAQVAALASVVFVAAVGLSVALRTPGGLPGPARQPGPAMVGHPPAPAPAHPGANETPAAGPPAPATASATLAAAEPTPGPAAALPAAEKAEAREDDVRRSQDAAGRTAMPAPTPEPQAKLAAAEPMPAPPASDSIVVTASRRARPVMDSATPVTVIGETDTSDIVITGSRTTRSRMSGRGDWNACTVDDPEQSLRGCRRLVDPGAKGVQGVAAARLSDGLTRAWQGDWNGAIEAFDRAAALQPKLAFAYLNRGLAYRHKGELERAAADLDLAVRHARFEARGYYNRSLVRRERGDVRGAKADAARAAELDPAYEQ